MHLLDPHTVVITLPVSAKLILALALWSLAWKGFALWYAGRAGQKIWFVVLLIANTCGILEIVYLLLFRPRSFALEKPGMDTSPAQR